MLRKYKKLMMEVSQRVKIQYKAKQTTKVSAMQKKATGDRREVGTVVYGERVHAKE